MKASSAFLFLLTLNIGCLAIPLAPAAARTPTIDASAIQTQAAGTVIARLTAAAQSTPKSVVIKTQAAETVIAGVTAAAMRPVPTIDYEATFQAKATATAQARECAREHPVPLGEVGHVSGLSITVLDLRRPDTSVNQTFVKSGNETVSVEIQVTCDKGNEKCEISPLEFKMTGSSGIVSNLFPASLAMKDLLPQTEMLGGATVSGWMAFEVPKGDRDLLLIRDWNGAIMFWTIPDK